MAKQDTTPTPSTADALDLLMLEELPAARTDGESGGSLYYRAKPVIEAHGGRGGFYFTGRFLPMVKTGPGPRDYQKLDTFIASPASQRAVIHPRCAWYVFEIACKCHTYGDPEGAVLFLSENGPDGEAELWAGAKLQNADAVRAQMRARARRAY